MAENKFEGGVNYIFCNDEYLRQLNKKFLNHDFYTDILTFETPFPNEKREETEIESISKADIFISIPRVRENAKKFKSSFDTELSRVMAHGILHLCGYGDKTKKEKLEMKRKEEESLALLRESILHK